MKKNIEVEPRSITAMDKRGWEVESRREAGVAMEGSTKILVLGKCPVFQLYWCQFPSWYHTTVCEMLPLGDTGQKVGKLFGLFLTIACDSTIMSKKFLNKKKNRRQRSLP